MVEHLAPTRAHRADLPRHRRRARARRLQRQDRRGARARTAPTRASRCAACWPAPRPKSTCGRSWRSTPTTCAAATAPPPASSMTTCCSICCRAASTRDTAQRLLQVGVPRGRRCEDRAARSCGARSRSAWSAQLQGRRPAGATVMAANASPALRPALRRRARARATFPILAREVHGQPLVFLDSAASSQRPLAVHRARSSDYETHSHANVHRGVHALSQEATAAVRGCARARARASSTRARRARSSSRAAPPSPSTSWRRPTARPRLQPGDEILITALEHHANIVPWQMVREQTGCSAQGGAHRPPRRARCSTSSPALLGPRTRLVAVRARLQCARHRAAGEAHHRRRARARRAWCWSTARRRCRTSASTCARWAADFYAFSAPQAVRPDRHRRALSAARRCSRPCRRGRAAAT